MENEKTLYLKTWLKQLLEGIVIHKEDLRITFTEDFQGILFTVSVNDDDARFVIGRAGKTADEIRSLLNTVGKHNEKLANIKFDVPVKNAS